MLTVGEVIIETYINNLTFLQKEAFQASERLKYLLLRPVKLFNIMGKVIILPIANLVETKVNKLLAQ
jgi:hypothetical protein